MIESSKKIAREGLDEGTSLCAFMCNLYLTPVIFPVIFTPVIFRAEQNEIEIIRAKLIESEKSGFITQTRDEILAEFKAELQHNVSL